MTVEYEIVEDGVLLVTLNRPERLNALNGAAKLALAQVWQRAQDDCAVRAMCCAVPVSGPLRRF
jgi:E-phenylitaconyl-CoA hydratase